MHPVRVEIGPITAITLKDELIQSGLKMDVDFRWSYQYPKWDNFSIVDTKHAIFEFENEMLATFYKLKWANRNV